MSTMSTSSIHSAFRVQAEQVAFRYPQNGHGLDPTTLLIRRGEFVLVSGPSGCGKSTLARCLTGLIPHLYRGRLTGAVWVDGLRTADVPLWRLVERAGMVFQNPAAQMLASSVEEEVAFGLENLGLPPEVIRERLETTLTRFGLAALRARSPQTLSGGEQQKLALAAIMARHPRVLVLDEPFSMLDSTAVAHLVNHLRDLSASGVTVVICEHRPEYLQSIPALRTTHLNGQASVPTLDPTHEAAVPIIDSYRPPFQLEVSGLTVRLGGRTVLRDVHLTATGGEVIAVVGRNGVGKTTLLRALAGLQEYQGRITVNGGQPDLGLAFENADLQLFNASVREEILYRVPNVDMALYAQLLDALGLSRYEGVPPLLLSEGEKKRVALATVLMRRPQHGVLLDEPSLGQDTTHKAMLVRIARGLANAGRLVILTTHDLSLASQADRLLLLGAEGLVADGPPAKVMRDPTPWAQIGLSVPAWVRIPHRERSAQ
jgi:energy-coupling factor transporter ATP-binding protein EcfA2